MPSIILATKLAWVSILLAFAVEKGVPVQPNEKTRIYERASAGEQTFTTTTARSKDASTVGTAVVSFEQL
jgi:hypothetical protein